MTLTFAWLLAVYNTRMIRNLPGMLHRLRDGARKADRVFNKKNSKISIGCLLVWFSVALLTQASVAFAQAAVVDGAGSAPAEASLSSGIAVPDPPVPDVPLPPSANDLVSDPVALQQAARDAAASVDFEARREQLKQQHNAESFERANQSTIPLSPEQVRKFMQRLEATQEAAIPPSAGQPRGEVKTQTVSLDPGAEAPTIYLAAGYVTTITIIDTSGQPWPILDVGVGGNFEVSPTASGTHVVRVAPLTRFGVGNLSVILKEFSTPIVFRLVAGEPRVHLRFDARIPSLGPNAKLSLMARERLVAGDGLIMAFLDNAPPKDAKRLKVSGVDTRTMAWQLNQKTFVRTPLSLLSPGWNASVASADGMTVYEIGDAPVLLLSDAGTMIRARLLRDDSNGQ